MFCLFSISTVLAATSEDVVAQKAELNQARTTLIASVRSAPRPQSGQKHRSSGNFAIENLPGGTKALIWRVKDGNGIHFDVMRDVSGGRDPVVWSNLHHNSRTNVKTNRSFYIANPRGATGDFIVEVYAEY
jgi:hypothetical protein